jgi:hypothetical protein
MFLNFTVSTVVYITEETLMILKSSTYVFEVRHPRCVSQNHKIKQQTLESQNNYIIYTECPRRKGQNFGRVFLMLKYTDVTQNTYVQS